MTAASTPTAHWRRWPGGAAKCAGASVDGTAVNSITNANALALGFGRWTSTINGSLVVSSTDQDTTGGSLQWTNTAQLAQHNNNLVFGSRYDQSQVSYSQDTDLARVIAFQTVVTPNKEYGFTANGLAPSAANPLSFTGSNVLGSVRLRSHVSELSVFLADTFEVTPRFNITASGSYDRTTVDQTGVNSQFLNDDGGYNWTDDVTGVSYYNPTYLGAYKFSNTGAGFVATPLGIPGGRDGRARRPTA